MGTWDATSFGNDTANDWAYDLEQSGDLSLVEATFDKVVDVGSEYLEAPYAEEAIAAAEVIAALLGRPCQPSPYTEKVAAWVTQHPTKPSRELLSKAVAVLERIVSGGSELKELWEGNDEWNAEVANLRSRLSAPKA